MGRHDWFRHEKWNAKIAEEFEAKLKRARSGFHKAQYLRIQAVILLSQTGKRRKSQAVHLFQRVIEEYPLEESQVYISHESLGDHFLETGEYEKAEHHFRIIIQYTKTTGRVVNGNMANLAFAEVILASNQGKKFNEAYKYFISYPEEELTFNGQRFYFANLGALLCDKMGKKKKAKQFAIKALELATIEKPDFYGHPTVGLVKASKDQLKELKKIANAV